VSDIVRYIRADLRETDEAQVVGHAPVAAHLQHPDGSMRMGALLTVFDYVGGLCAGLAALPDGWVVSTNLAAKRVREARVGPLCIRAQVLRTGRNNVVTGVEIRDEGDGEALIMDGVLTSSILVPENGPPKWERPLSISVGELDDTDVPAIPEWLGLRPIRHGVEIDLADRFRNPWNILHGGVVAMLVDLATEHVTGRRAADVVLHFVAPNRVGPVDATVQVLGRRSDGDVARVEIRDAGASRVTAIAVVTASDDD
jgi:acyl-coenzyme A thioesterase PaaI-like protein